MRHSKKIIFCLLFVCLFLASILYYFYFLKPHLILSKTTFDRLPAWQNDSSSDALTAFNKSCKKILLRDPKIDFNEKMPQAGSVQQWQTICLAAQQLKNPDNKMAKEFFESWFDPYLVRNNFNSHGIFTGYYLPLLTASLKQDKHYSVPIYSLPDDLVRVNLGLFKPELKHKRIVGQIKNHKLIPYPDRAEIMSLNPQKQVNVLAWGDNAVDVFFAQIQGSAILQLPNQQQFLIGYAGENGHAYTPIGKILIANGALTKKTVSMQTIKSWLASHPEQVNFILNHDASYIFFQRLKGNSPYGAEGVPLTPERTLAVDTRYIPLGVPIWLSTHVPSTNATPNSYQRLMMAQDTGGAIKGVIRADIYFGAGEDAAFKAGNMQYSGKYWLLLPKRTR